MNDYNEPRLAVLHILEISASIVLNVLMIVSGGGLMAWRNERRPPLDPRRPAQNAAMGCDGCHDDGDDHAHGDRTHPKGDAGARGPDAGSGAPRSGDLLIMGIMRWMMMFGAVMMVFSALVACVYPALTWWYLSRPPARAACMK